MTEHNQHVILLAHGSPHPSHGAAIALIVGRVRTYLPPKWSVSAAFLQHQPPNLSAAYAALPAGIHEPLVLPLLLSDGEHNQDDVPAVTQGQAVTAIKALTPDHLLDAILEVVQSDALAQGRDIWCDYILVTGGSRARNLDQHFEALQNHLREQLRRESEHGPIGVRLVTDPGHLGDAVQTAQRTLVIPLLVAPGVLLNRFTAAAQQESLAITEPVGQTNAFARALAARATDGAV
jgi:sirohydrochlorin ferrochelatase